MARRWRAFSRLQSTQNPSPSGEGCLTLIHVSRVCADDDASPHVVRHQGPNGPHFELLTPRGELRQRAVVVALEEVGRVAEYTGTAQTAVASACGQSALVREFGSQLDERAADVPVSVVDERSIASHELGCCSSGDARCSRPARLLNEAHPDTGGKGVTIRDDQGTRSNRADGARTS